MSLTSEVVLTEPRSCTLVRSKIGGSSVIPFFDFLTKLLKISEPIGIVLQGSSSCVRTCGDLRKTLIGGPKVSEMLDFVGFLGV